MSWLEDNEPKVKGRPGKSKKTTGSWRAVGESCGSNRCQSGLVGGGVVEVVVSKMADTYRMVCVSHFPRVVSCSGDWCCQQMAHSCFLLLPKRVKCGKKQSVGCTRVRPAPDVSQATPWCSGTPLPCRLPFQPLTPLSDRHPKCTQLVCVSVAPDQLEWWVVRVTPGHPLCLSLSPIVSRFFVSIPRHDPNGERRPITQPPALWQPPTHRPTHLCVMCHITSVLLGPVALSVMAFQTNELPFNCGLQTTIISSRNHGPLEVAGQMASKTIIIDVQLLLCLGLRSINHLMQSSI